jgi:cell wall assembly regulator SMI1
VKALNVKKIEFKNSEPAITSDDIVNLENDLSIKLPEELKKLLLKYNGGVLDGATQGDPSVFIDGEETTSLFSSLFSIQHGENTIEYNMDMLQITEEHIPLDQIPFGDDMGGNVFTISVSEEQPGEIYYWLMDVGEPEKIFAANSLSDFFGGEIEEEDE